MTELYKTGSLTGFGTDLITPTVPELNTTQDNKNTYNSASELAIAGFFGRVNYNYKERYMLEANLRYDGSSRFIGDKRWGLFPSFSLGWNIAREEFFEPLNSVEVGTLKLRGSWVSWVTTKPKPGIPSSRPCLPVLLTQVGC